MDTVISQYEDRAAYDRARYLANPDYFRQKTARWREANHARANERARERRAENHDIELAKERARRDPARSVAYSRKYAKAHPDVVALNCHRYRARKKANGVFEVTPRDWRRLCERFRWRCAYCGEKRKLTLDHVIPIARGGQHSIGNILPACRSCNAQKNARLLVEWRGCSSSIPA